MIPKVKYIIHRSKESFRIEKENYRKLIAYYQQRWPDLECVDKGLRFSLVCPRFEVDFDFGFHNMRYRDFSPYRTVFSQGTCALLKPEAKAGDIVFPSISGALRVNGTNTKVRLYEPEKTFENGMEQLYPKLLEFEKTSESQKLKDFVSRTFPTRGAGAFSGLKDLPVHHEARFVEANRFFVPSELPGAKTILKSGEDRVEIPDLEKYLIKHFDGVDMDAKQMIDNVGHKMCMFSIGTNHPYKGIEINDDIRFAEDPGQTLKDYDRRKVIYFQALLFGYLLENNFLV